MANRLGIFVVVVIIGIGILFVWFAGPSMINGGQQGMLIFFAVIAAIAYALIRGLGWVFTGK